MINYNNQKMYLLMLFFIAITLPLGQCNTAGSSSMKCYVCNNIDNPDCNDKPRSDKFIMDCDDFFANKSQTFKPTEKDYFCRKTIEQGSTFAGEENQIRIIRSCGNIRNTERSCYRTSDSQVKTETCECYDPLCNTADIRTSSSTFFKIIIPALTAILVNLS